MAVTPSPWRNRRPGHAPGLPAWSMPAGGYQDRPAPADLFDGVDADWAWGGADGAGVRVCVLDSGIDAGNPLVAPLDRAWHVVSESGRPPWVEECEPEDALGHGTACASIIRQIAPQVSLNSVKVLGDGRSGAASSLVAGLAFAVEQGFDVINLSLSTTRPEYRGRLAELCDWAYFRRCTLVVAAHNLPVQSFPWNFSSVISVASHAEPDPMLIYYNATPPVEFCARGVRVPVAGPGGRLNLSTGNSFAAPHIAGISTLALSKHPSLTPFQLKTVLYHCAANVTTQGVEDGVLVTRST